MEKLLQAVVELKEVFDTYAGKEGDSTTLTKKELSALLSKELDIKLNRKEAAEAIEELDKDGDGVVNFEEYATFVFALVMKLQEELFEN